MKGMNVVNREGVFHADFEGQNRARKLIVAFGIFST